MFCQYRIMRRPPARIVLACLWVTTLSFLGSLPAAATDLPAGRLYVCDSSADRVMALEDVNQSGTVEATDPDEVVVFYDDSSPGPDLSVPSHIAAVDDGSILLLDGGTLDAVLVLRDVNGDGDANDAGEVGNFYLSDTGDVSLATPNSLVRGAGDDWIISDDGSAARRIVRLTDSNRDGDANDAGEAVVVYDTTATAMPILEDVESVAVVSAGEMFVGDSALGSVFRLVDANGDGDFLDAGEVTVFFDGSKAMPLTDIDCLWVDSDASVLVCDEDSGAVYRLRDVDGNGDANDIGESQVVADGTAATSIQDTNDFAVAGDGTLVLLDGRADTVLLARDNNGDGDALDADEIRNWMAGDGDTFATPSGLVWIADAPVIDPGSIFIRGDANTDGKVTIADPIATLEFLFSGRNLTTCRDALDANDSGRLNVADPLYTLNFLFGGGPFIPPPFPEPGTDPTEDEIEC